MGYSFAFLGVLMFLMSIFLPSSLKEDMAENKAETTALNYLLYRNSVHMYLFTQDNFAGNVNDADLVLPTGFINKRWSASVQNGICYVYGSANDVEKNVVNTMGRGSHSIGEKRNGLFYPNHTDKNVVLPNFIPENALVSIMELK